MNCRCCHHPMDSQEQPALVPGRALTLITCRNVFCPMFDYTFTDDVYANVDVSQYCKPEPIDTATRQLEQLAAARRARIQEQTRIFRRVDFGTQGADGARGDGGTETAQEAEIRVLRTDTGTNAVIAKSSAEPRQIAAVVPPLCQMRKTPIPYGTYFSDDTDEDDGDNWQPGKYDDDVSRPPFRVR